MHTLILTYSHTPILHVAPVGKDGFEPPNSGENRFTVCCRWPLDYLPDGNHSPASRSGFLVPDRLAIEPEKGVEPATC